MDKRVSIVVNMPQDWQKLPSDKFKASGKTSFKSAVVIAVAVVVVATSLAGICFLMKSCFLAVSIKDCLFEVRGLLLQCNPLCCAAYALILAILCCAVYGVHCRFKLKLAFEDRKTEEMRRDFLLKSVDKAKDFFVPKKERKNEMTVNIVHRAEDGGAPETGIGSVAGGTESPATSGSVDGCSSLFINYQINYH